MLLSTHEFHVAYLHLNILKLAEAFLPPSNNMVTWMAWPNPLGCHALPCCGVAQGGGALTYESHGCCEVV